MGELSRINPQDSPLQLSDKLSLTTRSGQQLPDEQVAALGLLMAEVQARYPNQELRPGTTDMYLMEWERMALRFGLTTLRDALLRAMQGSRFFPDPVSIEEWCEQIDRDKANRRASDRINAEERHRREHPEEYEPWNWKKEIADCHARLAEKKARNAR